MKKVQLIASLALSTFILTAWSAISWTILPFHNNSLKTLNEQVINIKAMHRLVPNGVYHYPGLPADNTKESWVLLQDKLRTGPRVTLMVYRNEGSSLLDLKSLCLTILFNFMTSALLTFAILLTATKKASTILIMVLTIGLTTCFSKSLPFLIWFGFPADFIIPDLIDTLISFSLAAILLSYLNKAKA